MATLFREMLEKQAALKPDVKLYDHQQKAIDATGNNVVYAHATGSGKTLTGIAKFEKLKEQGQANHALVVVPSSLRDNFGKKGVGKFTDSTYNIIGSKEEIRKRLAHNMNPESDYNIISYDIFRKDPDRYIKESGADTILTDESHRTKNEDTLTTRAFSSDMFNQNIKNFIGLTGSITSNSPADLVPLVRQASRGTADIGKNKNEFIDRYAVRDNSKTYRGLSENRKPIVGLKNKLQLQNELSKYIHYLDHDDVKEVAQMPDTDLEVIKVPISKEQKRLYKKMLSDDPALRKMIVNKRFETLKDEEASMAFSKLVEMRKVMNDPSSVVGGKYESSPKLDRMVDDLEHHLATNPDGQALLLSHLIGGGIGSIEKELNERGIPYDRFIGKGNDGVTEQSRQQAVEDYNNRLKRVLLISGAGGEGISLNDTTFEGVLDPHFNPEKMQQMEARGVRSGGLSHRPKEERVVDVNRYISTMPKTFGLFNSSLSTPDEAIYAIAQRKERQNKIVHDMLKQVRKQQESKLLKTASDDSETMEKLASLDKLRKKRYWQYLKRLHGGSDEAVDYLSKTKDPGIYRAMSSGRNPLENGIASRPQPNAFAANKGVFVGEGEFVKKYYHKPVESNTYPTGGDLLLRLKYPSELEGKAIYPKATKVVRVDRPDTAVLGKKVNPRVMTNIEKDQVFRGKNFEDEFTHYVFDNQMMVRDDLPANILKKASEKSDALTEELLNERVIPYAKNYATGSLPGQLAGWGLGAKYIKTPDTGNKAVDLAAKAGAVGLTGSIGGSLGRGVSRAASLNNRFDEDLDRNPTLKEYLTSVPVSMVPFVGGAVATPEAIVRKIKEDEKVANSLFGDLLEKEAMNKVKAMLEAGQLSKRDVRRVLKPNVIADDVNSRISAKAKRFAEKNYIVRPEGPTPDFMTAKKYKNMSKPNNLSNAPAVDFRKETKYQGHRNTEMLNIARKDFGSPTKVTHVNDVVADGRTGVGWENGNINESRIELPKKDANKTIYRNGKNEREVRKLDPATAKQVRAVTARHEIQGELGGRDAKQRLFGKGGIDERKINFTRMNNHDNMGIPMDDSKMVSRLSPQTKHVNAASNRQNQLDADINYRGRSLHQGSYLNIFGDDFANNMDRPAWTRKWSSEQKERMMRDASNHRTGSTNENPVAKNVDILNQLDKRITNKIRDRYK